MYKSIVTIIIILYTNVLLSQKVIGVNYMMESYVTSTIKNNGSNNVFYKLHMDKWERRNNIAKTFLSVGVLFNLYSLSFYKSTSSLQNIYYMNVGVYFIYTCFYFSANKERKKAYNYI